MADNFNLRKFLTENKLTKNAQLLKEEQEDYKYFDEEGTGGFYMTTIEGEKIYSLEDSSIMDTCFYALEDEDGYIDFISIDVSGEPVSSEDIQNEQEILSYIADFIEEDINSQLKEEGLLETSHSMKNKMDEGSDYGFDALMDAASDLYPEGTPENGKLVFAIQKALHANQIDTSEFGDELNAATRAVEAIANEIGLEEGVEEAFQPESKLVQVAQQAWAEQDLEKAKRLILDLIEPSGVKSKEVIVANIKAIRNKREFDRYLANSILKFEKLGLGENKKQTMEENKLTAKELRLVEMVNNALKEDNGYATHDGSFGGDDSEEEDVDYTMGNQDDPNQLSNPASKITIPEGEDMVEEKPLPKYENIEKLMQEIEKSTDEAAHKYKMQEMKRVADGLEKKATALEEGDNAEHIDQKKLKQMKKDIMSLRKGIEKMEKLGEKKFTKKETKDTKPAESLAEGFFDLRKFLIENRK